MLAEVWRLRGDGGGEIAVVFVPPQEIVRQGLVADIDDRDWRYLLRFSKKYASDSAWFGTASDMYEFKWDDIKGFVDDAD